MITNIIVKIINASDNIMNLWLIIGIRLNVHVIDDVIKTILIIIMVR